MHGLFEMLIYLAAVLSFSTTIRKKLLGIAMGLPAIFVFNLVRITILLVAGAGSMEVFNFMHLYLWQVTLIVMISTIWIGWLYLVVYRDDRKAQARKNLWLFLAKLAIFTVIFGLLWFYYVQNLYPVILKPIVFSNSFKWIGVKKWRLSILLDHFTNIIPYVALICASPDLLKTGRKP